MHTPQKIQQNTIGTEFELTITDKSGVVNISSATAKSIIFKKPDETTLIKSAILVTDGTDGKIKYTTVAGDINLAGTWQVQAKVILPSGEYPSTVVEFVVKKNLV